MENKIRVIYYVSNLGSKLGGIERYFILIAQECKARGYEIAFIHENANINQDYKKRLLETGALIKFVDNPYLAPIQASIQVAKIIQDLKPHIVHTHFSSPILFTVFYLLRVPLIYTTFHSGLEKNIRFRTRLVRKFINFTTSSCFAVSHRVFEEAMLSGVKKEHILEIPIGIPVNNFLADIDGIQQPIPAGFADNQIKIIISVGRFFREKGMRYVVDAAVEVLKREPDVIWWLIGKDGPEKSYCLDTVEKAKLTDKVLFLGERNDVPALMKRAYLQVVGSLWEGLPLMALESAALGLPTVGPNIRGLDEIVIDGRTGLLVPHHSGTELAQATLKLINNKGLCERLGQAASDLVRSKYDSEKLVAELFGVYENDLKLKRL